MITIKSRSDLEKLREAGRVAAQALELAGKSIHPGMTTHQLDKILHDFIVHSGATPTLVIIGMVLHGDSVQEDGLVRAGLHALVLLDDLVGHGIIGDKAAGPVVLAHLGHAMHILKADKIVKAEVGVSLVAAPVFCPEAVHGSGLVALELEVIGHGKHGLGHMLLVGLAAAGQEGYRVAGKGFKLHIAGAAAKAGAVGPAIGAGLLQGVQVLGDIGIKGDAVLFQLRNIPVGLGCPLFYPACIEQI